MGNKTLNLEFGSEQERAEPSLDRRASIDSNLATFAGPVLSKLTSPFHHYHNLAMMSPKDSRPRVMGWGGNYEYWNGSGLGVDAYVFDPGVNIDHMEFGGRARNFKSRVYYNITGAIPAEERRFDTSDLADHSGHGTLVASLLGGKALGVAPNVTLLSVKTSFANMADAASLVVALDDVTRTHLDKIAANNDGFRQVRHLFLLLPHPNILWDAFRSLASSRILHSTLLTPNSLGV